VVDYRGRIISSYNKKIKLASSNTKTLKVKDISVSRGRGSSTAKAGKEPGIVIVTGSGSYLRGDSCEVVVFKVEISLSQFSACDGKKVNVDLIIEPSSVKDCISNVQFTATKPNGGTTFNNPSGKGITISKRGSDIAHWKIDNVRWYSTQANHCNPTSKYKIRASCKIDKTQYQTKPVYLTADTTFGRCLDGYAKFTQYFSGKPSYTTTYNSKTHRYETTVSQGTFKRDVQAKSWWRAPINSQYYNMVKNEEQYHEKQQMENPDHYIFGKTYLAENIMNDVQRYQPYENITKKGSLKLAQKAFEKFFKDEMRRSNNYWPKFRCDIEREAKAAVGASYRAAMPCTYPNCQ
ncbi:MAG: hypothetical protein ACTSUF_09830, partial [Candidatus Heimdallarchaeaceae archaeon]